MGDTGEAFRDYNDMKRRQKAKYTVDCPQCPKNRCPTRLWPGWKCKVCGYIDPRPRLKTPFGLKQVGPNTFEME